MRSMYLLLLLSIACSTYALNNKQDRCDDELTFLKSEYLQLESKYEKVLGLYSDLERRIGQMEIQNSQRKKKESKYPRRTSGVHSDFVIVPASLSENIGFTALRVDDNRLLNGSDTLVFNVVKSNNRNCYNNSTGMFTVDTAGTYVFYVNILCFPAQFVRTELVKDGIQLATQMCDGSNKYSNGSSMTVVELPVGAKVWVRTRDGRKNRLGGETSFSGFLLRRTFKLNRP